MQHYKTKMCYTITILYWLDTKTVFTSVGLIELSLFWELIFDGIWISVPPLQPASD
ncbi:hypothetical protein NIES80_15040 [Dolichospermum planctonicum]|uniref:Uncharacterized protein n=1 Tax=Dolichospermum planctonicum TaxID=136072 RepID=A0A480AA67_9CYAN|nr:hypothetical protein NIES80_15040 [Dolichospermum planctonicum]